MVISFNYQFYILDLIKYKLVSFHEPALLMFYAVKKRKIRIVRDYNNIIVICQNLLIYLNAGLVIIKYIDLYLLKLFSLYF